MVEIDGRAFLLEMRLRAEFALTGVKHADYSGNLDDALTARDLNPVMAMAADTVIAEVDEIVPVEVIPPDHVVAPSVDADRVVAATGARLVLNGPVREMMLPARRNRMPRRSNGSIPGC